MVEVEKYFGFGIPGDNAYGGFGDLIFKSDDLDEVIERLKGHKESRSYANSYWITDMETLKPVEIKDFN